MKAPKIPTSAEKSWTMPTAYVDRFGDAMQLLCAGHRPPDDMLRGWLKPDSEDERLQHFACEHGPHWAQGIGLIDAARLAADQPTEIETPFSDDKHEQFEQAEQTEAGTGGARAEALDFDLAFDLVPDAELDALNCVVLHQSDWNEFEVFQPSVKEFAHKVCRAQIELIQKTLTQTRG